MEKKIIENIEKTYRVLQEIESKIDLNNLTKENKFTIGTYLLTSADLFKKMVYYIELLDDKEILPEKIKLLYSNYIELQKPTEDIENEELKKIKEAILNKN